MILSKLSRSVATSIVVCNLISASLVAAETKKVVVDGKEGVWFDKESARLLLSNEVELAEIKKKLDLIERQLTLRSENILLLDRNLVLEKDVSKRALTRVTDLENQLVEISKRSEAWYKSPILWFVVGVTTTVVSAVAIKTAIGS